MSTNGELQSASHAGDASTEQSRPTILMVPGAGQSPLIYRLLMKALADVDIPHHFVQLPSMHTSGSNPTCDQDATTV